MNGIALTLHSTRFLSAIGGLPADARFSKASVNDAGDLRLIVTGTGLEHPFDFPLDYDEWVRLQAGKARVNPGPVAPAPSANAEPTAAEQPTPEPTAQDPSDGVQRVHNRRGRPPKA